MSDLRLSCQYIIFFNKHYYDFLKYKWSLNRSANYLVDKIYYYGSFLTVVIIVSQMNRNRLFKIARYLIEIPQQINKVKLRPYSTIQIIRIKQLFYHSILVYSC
jgi:hypothetical protein